MDPQEVLFQAFKDGVAATQPAPAVRRHLPTPPVGRTVVVGAGKGAVPMALAVDEAWHAPLSGVVITPYGATGERLPERIRVLEAAHPVPDTAGVAATREVLQAVQDLTTDDLVICLISGGGSALLSYPLGVTLEEKAALMSQFLKCGASIHEINTVRKHLSGIKGGQLAVAAAPARMVTLIVSDVTGDDLSTIASGPTVPDPTTFSDALTIIERYDIHSPAARSHLEHGMRGMIDETPKPDSPVFNRVENRLIATNRHTLDTAVRSLRTNGIEAQVTSDRIEGESRQVALEHAQEARELPHRRALLSGGETTVVVTGKGRGGPNLEYLLALAIALDGEPGIYALAADTDGIDGTGDAAGAVIAPDTLERAASLGLDPQAALADNDAYTLFASLDDLIVTGPTGTNVNDIRIILRV
ncbi:MAG: glycerate kinase [Fidelibacterota bacterium]|nr:MAG: glycerate kinase [Candidatus Neomarinimicrobiota bacterium]